MIECENESCRAWNESYHGNCVRHMTLEGMKECKTKQLCSHTTLITEEPVALDALTDEQLKKRLVKLTKQIDLLRDQYNEIINIIVSRGE